MKLQSILMTGLVVGATSAAQQVLNAFGEVSYGVDVSFPVHHLTFAQDEPIGNRRKLYEEFLNGCRAYYPDAPESCDLTEEDRVKMSIRQPASMQVRWMVLEGIALHARLSISDIHRYVSSTRIILTLGSKKSKRQKPSLNYSPTIGTRTMKNDPRKSGPAETRTSTIGRRQHTW